LKSTDCDVLTPMRTSILRDIHANLEALNEAKEALELWLESHLQERMLPPRPPRTFKTRKGKLLWVPVEPRLAVKLVLLWMREDLGVTQAELAKLAGVSQPAIAQLESPDSNATIDALNRVAQAMGAQIDLRRGRISVVLCTRPPLCILRSLPKSLTARSVELAAHWPYVRAREPARRSSGSNLALSGAQRSSSPLVEPPEPLTEF